jgi:hypothetical protein
MEHPLHQGRHQELVARSTGANLAAFGTRDRLGGQADEVDVNRQKIKGGASYDPSITVDGAYEEKFLTYYGIRWVAA